MHTKFSFFLLIVLSCNACTQSETASTHTIAEADEVKALASAADSTLHDADKLTHSTQSSDNVMLGNVMLDNEGLDSESVTSQYDPQKVRRANVSQQFVGMSPTEIRLAYALPELPYDTDNLPDDALLINAATWSKESVIDEALTIKLQALLNYNHHSIGAVDGRYGQNVIKAIEVFQQKHDLEVTGEINNETWNRLIEDADLKNVPVLVNYTLRQEDVNLPYHPKGQQYRSVTEAVAEKFHMSQGLFTRLNPNTKLRAGNTIVVYNPHQPNAVPIHRVVAHKAKNLLLAYDENDTLVASYPTTMGSSYKPSPNGNYKVLNRVIDPTYNRDFSNKSSVLPPGPNNPVGRVWIGINKPSYGIHGSPNPEKISQQKSSGCVRLTNWDALGLFGTIEIGAKVEFK